MNLKDKKFYKILPSDMICRGFEYKEGLNIDTKPFDNKKCSNGLHFSDSENILTFCDYGDLIAEVEMPEGEKVICFEDKYKAHSIILKNIRPLWDVEVFKELVKNGADIHADDDYALHWASVQGHLDIVKYLVEHGADIHSNDDCALRLASQKGHLDIVKYLLENRANIHARNDCALRLTSQKGHLDIVRYLKSILKKNEN